MGTAPLAIWGDFASHLAVSGNVSDCCDWVGGVAVLLAFSGLRFGSGSLETFWEVGVCQGVHRG